MNRYERRMQFERLCSLRDAYRAASPEEHRAVMTIAEAVEYAETLLLEPEAVARLAGVPEDAANQDEVPPREG